MKKEQIAQLLERLENACNLYQVLNAGVQGSCRK